MTVKSYWLFEARMTFLGIEGVCFNLLSSGASSQFSTIQNPNVMSKSEAGNIAWTLFQNKNLSHLAEWRTISQIDDAPYHYANTAQVHTPFRDPKSRHVSNVWLEMHVQRMCLRWVVTHGQWTEGECDATSLSRLCWWGQLLEMYSTITCLWYKNLGHKKNYQSWWADESNPETPVKTPHPSPLSLPSQMCSHQCGYMHHCCVHIRDKIQRV
jgi:hypothetical protein